ncbi:hypothetical protein MHBO_003041, partial [Bonamia ostreae]
MKWLQKRDNLLKIIFALDSQTEKGEQEDNQNEISQLLSNIFDYYFHNDFEMKSTNYQSKPEYSKMRHKSSFKLIICILNKIISKFASTDQKSENNQISTNELEKVHKIYFQKFLKSFFKISEMTLNSKEFSDAIQFRKCDLDSVSFLTKNSVFFLLPAIVTVLNTDSIINDKF